MKLRIEDEFEDVLMKASTGLGFGKQELAERAGLDVDAVASLLDGQADESALRAAAPALGLDADALVALANHRPYPETPALENFEQFTTPFPVPGYEEMTVNSYLVWNKATREAFAFDTGANVDAMLKEIGLHNLHLKALFLTHTHKDHIAAYETLREAMEQLPAYAPAKEPCGKAFPVAHADRFHIAGMSVEARLTDGHSPGGTTYVISGMGGMGRRHVAIVGDSLFCLSMGGAKDDYARALENNRKQILSLPDDTVLCPGHGPMTTVAFEKQHNPFFPEFK